LKPVLLAGVPMIGAVLVLSGGCNRATPVVAPAETLAVPVSQPVQRVVTDYVDFTGRTVAINSVNIVPRVTGYITRTPFREGGEVDVGDLLFEIDPRPYQAQYDQAASQVSLQEAQLELANATLRRYENLAKSTPGAVSPQDLDTYRAAVKEAEARVKAAEKSLEVYTLNKEFTRVTSPISGQVSRYYQTLGNLVNQDQTLLTTVVSLDPMFAYFDMDERTLIDIRKAIQGGKITPYGPNSSIPVFMSLPGENDFAHEGRIDFINNQVNSGTGSISMRGLFNNPKHTYGQEMAAAAMIGLGAISTRGPLPVFAGLMPARRPTGTGRLLSPGMFVRIRLPVGQPHDAILVFDSAIQSDQGLKYVYVIDAENKAQYVKVTTGALQEDGMRVVQGVPKDAWVAVGALQQIRAKMVVKPDRVPMPSIKSQIEKELTSPEKAKDKK
jgi:multidrug efflux system membrane fusion protein